MKWRLLVLCLMGMSAMADAAVAQRVIGTVAPYRNSVSNRVHLFQLAGMAVIYDQPTPGLPRVRLLTADGKLTDISSGILGNSLFDEYAWNEREHALYALPYGGPLYRFDASKRLFVRLGGSAFQYRSMRYIPNWGAMALVGRDGLSVVSGGQINRVRSRGILVGELYYIRDLPGFRALLLSNDKRQFIRTADGTIHFLGEGGIEEAHELKSRPAIQLSGPKVAFDVTMAKLADGVWSPSKVNRVPLDWTMDGMLRSFVPTLDATLVAQPTWQWLDRWRNRSGYYRLGADGLVRVGDYRQRTGGKFASVITLSSLHTDLLQTSGTDNAAYNFWRIARSGTMTGETFPHAVGRWFNIWETQGLVHLTGAGGVWLWDGRSTPRPITNYASPYRSALPLSDELLLSDGRSAILVSRHKQTTRLPHFPSGEVLQIACDRLIVIGSQIVEIDLPKRR